MPNLKTDDEMQLNVYISKEVVQRAKAKAALLNKELYKFVEEVLDKETQELKK